MTNATLKPETALRALFSQVHQDSGPTDDQSLDDALGLGRARVEEGFSLGQLLVTHGIHRMEPGDIPYSVIRDVYRALDLPPGAALADLGAGYGRIGFYGALAGRYVVHGIEIVPERVHEARRVQESLGLTGLHFEIGDLITAPWPDVSHYLMLNSVLPSLMPPVVGRLAKIAKSRNIVVVSAATSNLVFREQPWLVERVPDVPSAEPPANLRIYNSRQVN